LRKLNFQRHTRTMRGLDYENMNPGRMTDGADTTGRESISLYEGATRLPPAPSPEPVEEVSPHHPVPGERPHRRAQWDDVRACWVAWDEDAGDWLPVGGDR